MMSGKVRAFFATPLDVDAVKQIFSVRDDEEIIPAENNDSLNKLIAAMNSSRGKKIFFILVPNFPFNVLAQAGFIVGRDFISGMEFLSEIHGVPFNSYELLQMM